MPFQTTCAVFSSELAIDLAFLCRLPSSRQSSPIGNSLAPESLAAGGGRGKRRPRVPSIRDFSEIVLQMETPPRRAR